ncbi:MAG TPA: hypothetical protein VJZ32_10560 [Candidatus Bathyarchaeia archaeon]|nr:hypothetical protein [Candidatus Bathyarchaeia archaeon]
MEGLFIRGYTEIPTMIPITKTAAIMAINLNLDLVDEETPAIQ